MPNALFDEPDGGDTEVVVAVGQDPGALGLRDAIARGVADESLHDISRSIVSARATPAHRDGLLHIYRRRRKHTGGNELLLQQTDELISFLEGYTGDDLVMISMIDSKGWTRLFLGSADGPRILHWMKMFEPPGTESAQGPNAE